MYAWQKSLKSVFLDPEIDRGLVGRAKLEGVSKGALVVEFIEEGLCLPSAAVLPPFEGEEPVLAPKGPPPAPRILRSVYLAPELALRLSSRVSAERTHASQLIARFCAEGLARPPSGGAIALKAKQRLVVEHKAKIEELSRIAREASLDLEKAIAEFAKLCPHLQSTGNLPLSTCQDCGA